MQDLISFDVTGSPLVVTMMSAVGRKEFVKLVCGVCKQLAQRNPDELMLSDISMKVT